MTETDRVRQAAYWGPRPETADTAAQRLHRLLIELGEIDAYFSQWYRRGRSKEQARQSRIELTPEHLQEVVLTGVNRRPDRTVDAELGFRFGLWDGRDDGCFLSVSCGITLPLFPNVVQFYFPDDAAVASRLLRTDTATRILAATARAWEPDWANVASEAYLQGVPDRADPFTAPLPGWLLYVAARRGEVPPLPPAMQVIPVDKLGSIVVMAPELPRSASNGTAVQIDLAMQSLGSAGLLGPIIRSGPRA